LSLNPLADVWIAIHQRDPGRFAPDEKYDAILTGQSHILEVENNAAIFPFRIDECFQLGNIPLVDPSANGKDYFPVRRPLDSQHCVSCHVKCKSTAMRKLLKLKMLMGYEIGELRQLARKAGANQPGGRD
jgi:hypothetical protein